MASLSTASLNSFFEPLNGGTQAAATGFKIGAADLNTFYLAKSAGQGATAAATNLLVGSADLNTIFTKLGDAALPFSATLSPATATSGSCNFITGTCNATAQATALPVGGSGSYTYSWTYVSGVVFSIINATAATATFSKNSNIFNEVGQYQCTISDGVATPITLPMQVTLKHVDIN